MRGKEVRSGSESNNGWLSRGPIKKNVESSAGRVEDARGRGGVSCGGRWVGSRVLFSLG